MKKITLSLVFCLSLCGCAHAGWVSTTELNAAINGVIANFTGPTNGTTAAAVTNIVRPAVSNALVTATNSFYGISNPSNFVTATITNGLATTNYVNAITNGLATTNYVNTATNNFGNTVPVSLTNAANSYIGAINLYPNDLATLSFFAGISAGNATMTGIQNIGIGFVALFKNTNGNYNVAVGVGALINNTTGSYNVASGLQALPGNQSGNYNVAYGTRTLINNQSGSGNIALGHYSGYSLTGSSNIDIGNQGVAAESFITRIGDVQTDAYIAGIIHGNGSGLTNHLAFATNTPVVVYGHVTNGLCTWTTSP